MLAAVVLQVLHVGVAAQEPQQLDDDRAQVQLLGGQHREALRQVEADLPAEHAQRAGAGAVAALDAVLQDIGEQVQILPLGMVGGDLFGVDGRDGVHGPTLGANRPGWVVRRIGPSTGPGRLSRETALVEERLLGRRGGAAQGRVPVREAAEAGDDVAVGDGPFEAVGVAGVLQQPLEQRDAGFLVGQRLRMLVGQVEERPQLGRDGLVVAGGDGGGGDRPGLAVGGEGVSAAPVEVAGNWSSRISRARAPSASAAQASYLPRAAARWAGSNFRRMASSNASDLANHLAGPAAVRS